MPHPQDLSLHPLMPQNLHQMPIHLLQPIRLQLLRLIPIAIAQHVRGKDPILSRRERANLVPPVIAGAGEAIEKEEG